MANNKLINSIVWITILYLGSLTAQAQNGTKKYFIYFKDKNNSSYSIKKPQEFLTKRAIDRRERQNINITERDLPVNADYLTALKNTGANVWYPSKWMNGAMVAATNEQLTAIAALPFVKSSLALTDKEGAQKQSRTWQKPTYTEKIPIIIGGNEDYGKGLEQALQIGATEMHTLGFKGEGMIIAVFDAGFDGVDKGNGFKHLFANSKILGTYNIVEQNDYVYFASSHGTGVLSTIAAYDKGNMIGTAPEASFYLFRTEDASTEYKVEELNWLIAAEKADSLGVDVINSSLGYTNFDDKATSYTYPQMDGNTAFITQAADFAAATGMLVVTSAGNEGNDPWQYISAPADADSVLTVGATDGKGNYAYFSSKGYTSDKRIKPNIVAKGAPATVITPSGSISTANGTSFSSPIICGLATGFWQANPKLNNMEVIDYLQRSGSKAAQPDSLMGYGIPNFKKAHNLVEEKKKTKSGFNMYPNPVIDEQLLRVYFSEELRGKDIDILLYDNNGKLVRQEKLTNAQEEYYLQITENLTKGIYTLCLQTEATILSQKVLKL